MTALSILPLPQQPQWVATLAEWHHREWGALFGPAWSLQIAHEELQQQAAQPPEAVPVTLLALRGNDLLGSVSVVAEDAPELDALGSPWLASLYVCPEARGAGIGSRLVQAAIAHARARSVSRMLLFTPDRAAFYRRLGWAELQRAEVFGHPVQVMQWLADPAA